MRVRSRLYQTPINVREVAFHVISLMVKHIHLFQNDVLSAAALSKMAVQYAYWHSINTVGNIRLICS
jgi:hypothetical protein